MGKIRILPDILSSKIAAGEVVERPSSVTKELIENAIDAQSTKIIIEIDKGGISLIRVSDNGIGMNKDDALLSLERYATSKVRNADDLFSIKTLGFRGEAIPSIASVSNFSMIVKEKNSPIGTKITVNGGKIQKVSDCGAAEGVVTTVKNLFFNIPARRKFLKSVNTEIAHIADTITRMALANPTIAFRLIHNSKIMKDWPHSNNYINRISDVLGSNITKKFLSLKAEKGNIYVEGCIVDPQINRSTSKNIYFFVNGRSVKNKIMHHALLSGYKNKLMRGQYPIAIVFINLPYNQVDVNVHPSKNEVRFLNQKQIHDFLSATILKKLKFLDEIKWNNSVNKTFTTSKKENISEIEFLNVADYQSATDIVSNKIKKTNSIYTCKPNLLPKKTKISENHNKKDQLNTSKQTTLWEKQFFSDLIIIGQFHNTYIICESKENLIIIDQHAAHERIVFENLKLNTYKVNPAFQNLLFPELIEINFIEAKILKNLIPHLKSCGLEIEPFDGNTFAIKTVPKIIDTDTVSTLIGKLIEKASNVASKSNIKDIMDECLSVIACHNAIRGNQTLSIREINKMMNQLDNCDDSSHCPHGRPTWIQLELSDFKKRFGRIM